ncbi:MAG: hypothetical protein PHS16_00520 [Candidatus Colwellbacteria bacterium]|jgi:hypothetical protein|nr:hypothetical protein [Candidatus Colwellbacteria bacterium]MCK9497607.1 hypothetical protein [Candidatus Colwellbacteria bacterium]MDD3752417.1 hypothetical protein [Candidatus Colwellbacteria bacterium]MDD4818800.1 hypothetical protein [Candidatus Colwellbacteria bacterium]
MDRAKQFKIRILLKKAAYFLAALVLISSIGAGLWFFRNGEFIKINNIEVNGTVMIPPGEVIELIKGDTGHRGGFLGTILPSEHLFAYKSEEEIRSEIISLYPRIKNISVSKDLESKQILVSISERKEEIIWCKESETPRDCFWLDNEGLIIGTAPDSKGTLVLVITDNTGRDIKKGEFAIEKYKLEHLSQMFELAKSLSWVIEKISISDPALKEALFDISSGQEIFISLERNPLTEGKPILDAIIAAGKWPQVDYVDLRIEGKGFYRVE